MSEMDHLLQQVIGKSWVDGGHDIQEVSLRQWLNVNLCRRDNGTGDNDTKDDDTKDDDTKDNGSQ